MLVPDVQVAYLGSLGRAQSPDFALAHFPRFAAAGRDEEVMSFDEILFV
jgi:hypothetical protein